MSAGATYTPDNSWSRSSSVETVFSLQDRETDVVRDTSDTDRSDVEYEPVTDSEDECHFDEDTGESASDIIQTRVVTVSVHNDGDVQFADSERTDTYESDSELDLADYWQCAQCRARNNNPRYRYCHECFKERQNSFPPRPKWKRKRFIKKTGDVLSPLSQDSAIESVNSQELSTVDTGESTSQCKITNVRLGKRQRSLSPQRKRMRSDSDSSCDVSPVTKTISDPSITVENDIKITKKLIANNLKDKINGNMCIICCSEPKSGVFVHGRLAHICCCYKCAVKVWTKAKRCPICNRKVSNVLRAIVM